MLLVEQNVAMALEIADRAYLLEEGRIVAEGTPEAVFDSPELRRAYLGIGERSMSRSRPFIAIIPPREELKSCPGHPSASSSAATGASRSTGASRWRWRGSSRTASLGAGSASTTCRCTTRTSRRTGPRPCGASPREVASGPAVLFVTPEHNRSIPAVLKNAIDWGSKPTDKQVWRGKRRGDHGHVDRRDRHGRRPAAPAADPRHPRHDRDGRRGVHLVQAGSRRPRRQFPRRERSARSARRTWTSSSRWSRGSPIRASRKGRRFRRGLP